MPTCYQCIYLTPTNPILWRKPICPNQQNNTEILLQNIHEVCMVALCKIVIKFDPLLLFMKIDAITLIYGLKLTLSIPNTTHIYIRKLYNQAGI